MNTATELIEKMKGGVELTAEEVQQLLKTAGSELEALKASDPERYLSLLNALNAGMQELNTALSAE